MQKFLKENWGNYLLNPNKSKGKSNFFNSIGYNMKNVERLKKDIRKGLENNKALSYNENKYGNRAYEVDMPLGINKKVTVKTAWQIDKGKNVPKFVSAYPKERKRGKQ